MPAAGKKATCEAAWLVMTNPDGLFSNDNDRVVISERVDVLQTTYAVGKDTGKAATTRFEILDKLLKVFFKANASNGSSIGASAVVRV